MGNFYTVPNLQPEANHSEGEMTEEQPQLYLTNTLYVLKKISKQQLPQWTDFWKDNKTVYFEWKTADQYILLVLTPDGKVFFSSNTGYSDSSISIEQAVYDIADKLGVF